MSVRSSVFESLTASVAVTRSNVIGSYTAETDTHSQPHVASAQRSRARGAAQTHGSLLEPWGGPAYGSIRAARSIIVESELLGVFF